MMHGVFEDLEPTMVFKLGQITFLPHYHIFKKYVAPGYNERFYPATFTAEQLRMFGAKEYTMKLWKRAWKN